jgi:hypothetical protein
LLLHQVLDERSRRNRKPKSAGKELMSEFFKKEVSNQKEGTGQPKVAIKSVTPFSGPALINKANVSKDKGSNIKKSVKVFAPGVEDLEYQISQKLG